MSDYASAINRALEDEFETLRNYGRLLAQAGIDLKTDALADDGHVRQGYRQQLTDFPNG
jgi:hypothetical protein